MLILISGVIAVLALGAKLVVSSGNFTETVINTVDGIFGLSVAVFTFIGATVS